MSATRQRIFKSVETAIKQRKLSRKPQIREAQKKKQSSWGIVKGDKVQVIGNHPEAGKQGIILKVLRDRDRVIVEGVNMGKKWVGGNPELGIKGDKQIDAERTIHYSKVNLVDPETGKPTRFYRKILEDGTKVRVSKRSGAIIRKPEIEPPPPVSSFVSDKCTVDEDVWEQTYVPK